MIPLTLYLLTTLRASEITCLGPVGHQVSALELATATVDQGSEVFGRNELLSERACADAEALPTTRKAELR